MGRIFVATSELREYAQRVTDRRSSFNQIAHLFEQLGFERRTSGRPRGFLLPELPEARRAWDRVKSPVRWNEVTKWSRVNDPFDDDPVPSER
jgi:hypothetical protein